MRRIGLVACSSKKNIEAENDHSKKLPASEMYEGSDFIKAVDKGLEYFECEGYFILSDKYGLLSPSDAIQYYDKGGYKSKAWADDVYAALIQKLGSVDDIEFIFFAGKSYWRFLKKRLNCKTLKFSPRRLTFEISGENKL